MLLHVCDPPETIGIGIIQPDETKTCIKKHENARGYTLDKLFPGAYTTYFNVKRQRSDHFFQGRYCEVSVHLPFRNVDRW